MSNAVLSNTASNAKGATIGIFDFGKNVNFFPMEKDTSHVLTFVPFVRSIETFNCGVPAGAEDYMQVYFIHRDIGNSTEAILCPSTFKKKCPICEERQRLIKSGVDYKEQHVHVLKPRKRVIYNILEVIGDNKHLKVWDTSYFTVGQLIDEKIIAQQKKNRKESLFFNFASVKNGSCLEFLFKEDSAGGYKFTKVADIEATARPWDISKEFLEEAIPLDKCFKPLKSYEELDRILKGDTSSDISDDDLPDFFNASSTEEVSQVQTNEAPKFTTSKTTLLKCPNPSGQFGRDVETLDECSACNIWKECTTEAEKNSMGV